MFSQKYLLAGLLAIPIVLLPPALHAIALTREAVDSLLSYFFVNDSGICIFPGLVNKDVFTAVPECGNFLIIPYTETLEQERRIQTTGR